MGTAVDDCFSPTYHVPSGTSRAKAGSVSSDPFGRKLRHGRSRERRSQRGRHHAKGTRYVGEIGFIAAMLAPLESSRPIVPVIKTPLGFFSPFKLKLCYGRVHHDVDRLECRDHD